MKKYFLLIPCLLLGVSLSNAAPRLQYQVTKTYRNDGNKRSDFLVSLTSTSWTQILKSDETRRYAIVYATASVLVTDVCITTMTSTSVDACTTTTIGRHIPSTFGVIIEDYSEAPLYGRIGGGALSLPSFGVNLYGEYLNDNGD